MNKIEMTLEVMSPEIPESFFTLRFLLTVTMNIIIEISRVYLRYKEF